MTTRTTINPTLNAYRTGLRRGLSSLRITLTTASDVLGSVLPLALGVGVLLFMRNFGFGESELSLGAMNLPSLIGMNVVFSGVMGILGVLVMDRTNGTLLRAKSVPGGTIGYLIGEVLAVAIITVITTLALLVAGLLLFDGLVFDSPVRWLGFFGVMCLGLAATLPLGAVLGALIENPRNMGLVMLPFMGLVGVSGVFYPITALPAWLQYIGQAFPMYWMGLGMRSTLLPDTMVAVEIGASWRVPEMLLVLSAWTIVGLVLAPRLLSRMARRESGSAVDRRRAELRQDWGG